MHTICAESEAHSLPSSLTAPRVQHLVVAWGARTPCAQDRNAFRAALRQLGIMIWVDEADALFAVMDLNGDGVVDSDEFFTGLLQDANAVVES